MMRACSRVIATNEICAKQCLLCERVCVQYCVYKCYCIIKRTDYDYEAGFIWVRNKVVLSVAWDSFV